jgi:hypothetical protein
MEMKELDPRENERRNVRGVERQPRDESLTSSDTSRSLKRPQPASRFPLRHLIRVRNQRRKELRSILLDRQKMVDTLLLLKKGPTTEEPDASTTPPARAEARVKRYCNEKPNLR